MVDGLQQKGAPNLELLPEGRGYLLVEFGADDAADSRGGGAASRRARCGSCADAPHIADLHAGRSARRCGRSASRARAPRPPCPGMPPRCEGWDDAAVAPEKLGAYLRDLRKLLDEYNYQAAFYGHFGHGCIHMQVSFDLQSEHGIRKYGEFVDRAADLVVQLRRLAVRRARRRPVARRAAARRCSAPS